MKNLWTWKKQESLFGTLIEDRIINIIPKDSKLVKMREIIPWGEIVEKVSECYL